MQANQFGGGGKVQNRTNGNAYYPGMLIDLGPVRPKASPRIAIRGGQQSQSRNSLGSLVTRDYFDSGKYNGSSLQGMRVLTL